MKKMASLLALGAYGSDEDDDSSAPYGARAQRANQGSVAHAGRFSQAACACACVCVCVCACACAGQGGQAVCGRDARGRRQGRWRPGCEAGADGHGTASACRGRGAHPATATVVRSGSDTQGIDGIGRFAAATQGRVGHAPTHCQRGWRSRWGRCPGAHARCGGSPERPGWAGTRRCGRPQ
jgi:hypothetical protein